MTPYYEQDGIVIYHGDCREVLPSLTSKSACVITDPPYGIGFQSNAVRGRFEQVTGDHEIPTDWADFIRDCCVECARVYWFCGESGIGAVREALSSRNFVLNRMLVWNKCAQTQGDLGDYGNQTEYIVTASMWRGKPPLRGLRDGNLISVPRIDPRLLVHPCEKPNELMTYLILRATDHGEIVLDPFAGSGATLFASRALGSRAIGIEIEERWCERAALRCSQEVLGLVG